MAIDTARKRASSLSALRPFMPALMVPTGTLGRQAAAWMYSGITADLPSIVAEFITFNSVTLGRPNLSSVSIGIPFFDKSTIGS